MDRTPVNLYDFDKTIYKKDSSMAFYFFCIKKKPYLIFHLFFVAILYILNVFSFITIEKLKEHYFKIITFFDNKDQLINKFWEKEKKNIQPWYLSQKASTDVICTASPEFLIAPIFEQINPSATIIGTQITIEDKKVICKKNCKGEEKFNRILQYFNDNEIKFDSAYTDSVSDLPMLDLAENKFIVCADKVYKFSEQKPTFKTKIIYSIKLLRIKHWIKNLLIFLPLVFSHELFSYKFFDLIVGVIAFCFVSSFVYVLNDLIDVKKDRLHSTKRMRPIASYMIKPKEAVILGSLCLAAGGGITLLYFNFDILIISILLIYCVVNILYSTILKKIPIIDVFILSFCYVLRLFFGGAIVDISISNWLYLTTISASLFMGVSKRRNELRSEKNSTRDVNRSYSYVFLDKNLYVFQALTLIFYSLWAIEMDPISAYSLTNILFLATIPLVYFIMMRYSYQIEKNNNSGNPVEVLLKDKILLFSAILFVVMIFIAIYFPIPINII